MKYIKQIGLILLLISILISCTREVEDLFDQSAAQRLETTKDNIYNALITAPNGWEFRYFATENDPGYVLLVEFFDNDSTVVAAKNSAVTGNQYIIASSAWEVIGDNGPVLTFNTYNDVLHEFSDPQNDGVGLGGDYEFIIMEAENDYLKLKGKKTGTYMTMQRLAAEQSWDEHYDVLADTDSYLFHSTVDLELKDAGNSYYTLTNGTSHVFTVFPYGADESDEDLLPAYIPFVLLVDGIDFNLPFEVNGKSVQSFRFNTDKTRLISTESPDVEIAAQNIYAYFSQGLSMYYATEIRLFGRYLTAFQIMKSDFNTIYTGKRDLENVGFAGRNNLFAFMLSTTSNKALFSVPVSVVDERLAISDFDWANMNHSDMDNNARLFYNGVNSIKDFLSLLPGSYLLSAEESPFALNRIEMTSITDANDKMILIR